MALRLTACGSVAKVATAGTRVAPGGKGLTWEGDVTIKGTIDGASVSGDGYTELTPPAG